MHIGSNSAFEVYTSFPPNARKLKSAMNRLAKATGPKAPQPTPATGSRVRAAEAGTTNRQGADRANSMMQSAEGWLSSIDEKLSAMRRLSGKPGVTDDFDTARSRVNESLKQYQALRKDDELQQFLSNSVDGYAELPDLGRTELGNEISETAIDELAEAVSGARKQVAEQKSAVVTTREGIMENIRAAENRIRDRRIAEQMTNRAKDEILNKIDSALQTQARPLSDNAISLLN